MELTSLDDLDTWIIAMLTQKMKKTVHHFAIMLHSYCIHSARHHTFQNSCPIIAQIITTVMNHDHLSYQ